MARPLRALYVFTARKRRLLARAARGEEPDTLLFGFNHLAPHGVAGEFYEPDYPPLGQAVARQVGRLGPDALQLRTLRRFSQYDVVFLTGGWPLLLAARAIPARRRPKLVWLNLTLTSLLRRGGPLATLLGLAARQADRIVCVAEHQRTFLRQRLGLPAGRLPLVLSGTDAAFFDAARARPQDGGAPYVLAAGRDPGRDYATLFAAMPADTPLHVVCSPRNLAGLALPPHVSVRYDIPPAALREEYACTAAVAVPTHGDQSVRGSDCSGTLVLLDALAMGQPSVISDRASVHDYISAGTHALVVPPGQPAALRAAVERLLRDRAFATSLGAAGRELVRQRLTSAHFAARLAEVFYEVVS